MVLSAMAVPSEPCIVDPVLAGKEIKRKFGSFYEVADGSYFLFLADQPLIMTGL